ncbi:MAG TPA: phenylacetate--CoA ligase family protein [Dermatophilaceae bacterium]
MDKSPGSVRVILDLLRAQREGVSGLSRRQEMRLVALVTHARSESGYYERLYQGLPVGRVDLPELPPVTKPELMAAFDDWVTDPAVTRAGVESFMSDPARIGTPYLGRYFVCSTSGTTGHPGLFVHDRGASTVYQAINYRIDLAWLSAREWWGLCRRRLRWASVYGTGGHFAGEGWIEFQRRRSSWKRRSFRVFSLQQPLAEVVGALNAFQPAVLTSYPSVLELLAEEQVAGRLRLRPVLVELAGESVDADGRAGLAAALGGALRDAYGASECVLMAFDCVQGWLHVNSDWVILEPVEADYSPTPPGESSHTVLLTNLANRVQPIIRYDLGDSVVARPEPCPCGNPLPAIRVQGRRDDVLRLQATNGRTVSVPPLVVGSVLDKTPGVHRSQLVQTGPRSVLLRIDVKSDVPEVQVWEDAISNLVEYLAAQELSDIQIVRAAEAPERSSTSGKYRQVIVGPRASIT